MPSRVTAVTRYQTSDGKTFATPEEAEAKQKEIDELEANSSLLPWEYCECGCHGLEFDIAGVTYWTTSDSNHSSWYLGIGHSFASSKRLGEFKSERRRDEFLIKEFLSKLAPTIEGQIAILKKQLEAVKKFDQPK